MVPQRIYFEFRFVVHLCQCPQETSWNTTLHLKFARSVPHETRKTPNTLQVLGRSGKSGTRKIALFTMVDLLRRWRPALLLLSGSVSKKRIASVTLFSLVMVMVLYFGRVSALKPWTREHHYQGRLCWSSSKAQGDKVKKAEEHMEGRK